MLGFLVFLRLRAMPVGLGTAGALFSDGGRVVSRETFVGSMFSGAVTFRDFVPENTGRRCSILSIWRFFVFWVIVCKSQQTSAISKK